MKKQRQGKKPPAYEINEQPIPGSVWGKLRNKCSTSYEAGLCLYRARNAEKIVPYLLNGIREGWIFQATAEEENGSAAARDWVEEHILKYEKKREPVVTVREKNMTGIGAIMEKIKTR